VASLAGSEAFGATKSGENIIPVIRGYGSLDASTLFDALLWIVDHVRQHEKMGKAVINYSAGKEPPIQFPTLATCALALLS
jgi:hypothetical protein